MSDVIEEVSVHATATDPLMELLELDVGPDVDTRPPSEPTRRGWFRNPAVAAAAGALALAAVALAVALSRPTTVTTAEPAVPTAVPAFAEMYVAAYLTAAGPEGGEALRSFYPAMPDLDFAGGGDRFVTQVVTTAVSPDAPGSWRVETAATVLVGNASGYVSDGIHHYVVGVVATDNGLAAVGLPGRIPAPAAAAVPATLDGAPVEDESLRHAVEAFLAAYLLGAGDLGHLVASGSGIVPVTPAPYRTITVGQVTSVATDGAHQVRVTATAAPPLGSPLPIELHLLVLAESGAWKVAATAAGPPWRG